MCLFSQSRGTGKGSFPSARQWLMWQDLSHNSCSSFHSSLQCAL